MGRIRRWWGIYVVVGAIGVVMCAAAASASAATLTVNTVGDNSFLGDGGKCTLRDAISAVESPGTSTTCGVADSGANSIVLGADTYMLNDNLIRGMPPPTGCLQGSSPSNSNSLGNLWVSGNVQNLTIKGAGRSATVIDACRLADRAFNIQAGASVTIKDLTITNGRAPDGNPGAGAGAGGGNGGAGGAILNDGTLSLDHVTISNSQAGSGGFGQAGTGTSSGDGGFGGLGGDGGGIFNDSGGTLNVIDSTVSGDSAGAGGAGGAGETGGTGAGGIGGSGEGGGIGGGIDSLGGLSISSSTIVGNQAGVGGDGATGGPADSNSSQNGGQGGSGGTAGAGGGVATEGGSSSITNSTITGNVTGDGGHSAVGGTGPANDLGRGGNGGNGGAGGIGGGLFLAHLTASSVLNATVASNSAGSGQPGAPAIDSGTAGTAGRNGIGSEVFVQTLHFQLGNTAPTTFTNTLVVGTGEGICATAVSTTFANVTVNGGHNLAFAPPAIGPLPPANERCSGGFAGGFAGGDPKLGPLQNNLGPTHTMALGAGSAAINQIPPGSDCPTTDQRGSKRPSGPECDIGAYEVTPPAVSPAGATAITATAATIHGKVTANQVKATVRFQFGKTTAYGSQTTVQTVGGATAVAIAAHLTGLMPGKKYHYRVVATSSDGTSKSADATFTTKALVITGLKITPTQFKPGKPGATISYTDSAAAMTTFQILSARLVKIATFVHTDKKGKVSFRFTAVLNNHALASGTYRLEATPRLNGVAGKTVSVGFKVT
jgi:hypothetical protein